MRIKLAETNSIENPELYETSEEMVRDLIRFVPIEPTDIVLDAGSGRNLVWYNNLPVPIENRRECDLERMCNFFEWKEQVDWVVGFPSGHVGWGFTVKATEIARKGFAFLGNLDFLNLYTPRRLEQLKDKGFYLQHIRITQDKRWFGRYYFLVWGRENPNIISWNIGEV